MDGSDGSSFPSNEGFCAFLVADEDSNGDSYTTNTPEEVAPLLAATGSSTFFGVVPRSQLAVTGNTYGHLAALTGGIVMDIAEFVTDDAKAAVMVDQMLAACVHSVVTTAGCTTNGPYIFNQTKVPLEITLAGSPTCSDGNAPFDAYWTSESPQLTIQTAMNNATALVEAAGEHRVCHTVKCNDQSLGTVVASTCCTEVVVIPAPIVTEGRMIAVQGSMKQIGGSSESRRNLRYSTTQPIAPTMHALASYGGPDDQFGVSVFCPGYLMGISVVLEKPLIAGEIRFYLKVNGIKATGNEVLSFTPVDGVSKVIELAHPIPVYAGDVVEIALLESRFTGEVPGLVEDVLPAMNKAGFTIILEH